MYSKSDGGSHEGVPQLSTNKIVPLGPPRSRTIVPRRPVDNCRTASPLFSLFINYSASDSNREPTAHKTGALTVELAEIKCLNFLVYKQLMLAAHLGQ